MVEYNSTLLSTILCIRSLYSCTVQLSTVITTVTIFSKSCMMMNQWTRVRNLENYWMEWSQVSCCGKLTWFMCLLYKKYVSIQLIHVKLHNRFFCISQNVIYYSWWLYRNQETFILETKLSRSGSGRLMKRYYFLDFNQSNFWSPIPNYFKGR